MTFLPRLVQMSFHDCKGGCDGCVDVHGNHGNKGTCVLYSDQYYYYLLSTFALRLPLLVEVLADTILDVKKVARIGLKLLNVKLRKKLTLLLLSMNPK